KSLGQASTEAGKASGAVRSRLGTLSSGTTYNKTSALKNIWKIGSTAAIGFLSEGLFEENVQLAISRSAEEEFGGNREFGLGRPRTSEEEVDQMQRENALIDGLSL